MLSLNLANCFVMSEFFLNIPGLPALLEGLNTHSLTCLKMTKNGCLLSMVMSYIIGKPKNRCSSSMVEFYTFGKPTRRKSQKKNFFFFDSPLHFLLHPKIGPRPK